MQVQERPTQQWQKPRTYAPRARELEQSWHLVDAEGLVLGRMASEIAELLMGKHKTTFARNAAGGDQVVVVNARAVHLSGRKAAQKLIHTHSGYPGGIKTERYADFLERRPHDALRRTVRGMLPKNKIGEQLIKRLHVFGGPEHVHHAQQPQPIELECKRRMDARRGPQIANHNPVVSGSVTQHYAVGADAVMGTGLRFMIGHGEHESVLRAELYDDGPVLHWRTKLGPAEVMAKLDSNHDSAAVGIARGAGIKWGDKPLAVQRLRLMLMKTGESADFLRVEGEPATYTWRRMSTGDGEVSFMVDDFRSPGSSDAVVNAVRRTGVDLDQRIVDGVVAEAIEVWLKLGVLRSK